MTQNTKETVLVLAVLSYRLICLAIAAVVAMNGTWWFAIVLVLLSLIVSVNSGGPKDQK